jgi:hypothetical protein
VLSPPPPPRARPRFFGSQAGGTSATCVPDRCRDTKMPHAPVRIDMSVSFTFDVYPSAKCRRVSALVADASRQKPELVL